MPVVAIPQHVHFHIHFPQLPSSPHNNQVTIWYVRSQSKIYFYRRILKEKNINSLKMRGKHNLLTGFCTRLPCDN